jgi:hypothetical protein
MIDPESQIKDESNHRSDFVFGREAGGIDYIVTIERNSLNLGSRHS